MREDPKLADAYLTPRTSSLPPQQRMPKCLVVKLYQIKICVFTCKNNKKKLKQQGIEDKQHQLSLSREGKRPKNIHIHCKMNSIVKKKNAFFLDNQALII